jgi:hypothetical protein
MDVPTAIPRFYIVMAPASTGTTSTSIAAVTSSPQTKSGHLKMDSLREELKQRLPWRRSATREVAETY